jgi:hypothetical protein
MKSKNKSKSILKIDNKKELDEILNHINNVIYFDYTNKKFYRKIYKKNKIILHLMKVKARYKNNKQSKTIQFSFTYNNINYYIYPQYLLFYIHYQYLPKKIITPIDNNWINMDIKNWDYIDNNTFKNVIKRIKKYIKENPYDNINNNTREKDLGLTQKYLNKRLLYDKNTGKLYWKYNPNYNINWNERYANKECGRIIKEKRNNYKYKTRKLTISIDGKQHTFSVARIIWILVYNEFPNIIDHIDRNPLNNKLNNLRNVTHYINNRNRSILESNKSGISGVLKYHKKFYATISYKSKLFTGPLRDTIDNAKQDRLIFEKLIGGYII